MPLHKRSISGGGADGRRQNRLCVQSRRHATNQRSKACDVGGATTSLESPKTCPSPHTRLRPAKMALVLQSKIAENDVNEKMIKDRGFPSDVQVNFQHA